MRRPVSSGEHGSQPLSLTVSRTEAGIPTGPQGKLPRLKHHYDHAKSGLKQQYLPR